MITSVENLRPYKNQTWNDLELALMCCAPRVVDVGGGVWTLDKGGIRRNGSYWDSPNTEQTRSGVFTTDFPDFKTANKLGPFTDKIPGVTDDILAPPEVVSEWPDDDECMKNFVWKDRGNAFWRWTDDGWMRATGANYYYGHYSRPLSDMAPFTRAVDCS